jgi:hypothetical protein
MGRSHQWEWKNMEFLGFYGILWDFMRIDGGNLWEFVVHHSRLYTVICVFDEWRYLIYNIYNRVCLIIN